MGSPHKDKLQNPSNRGFFMRGFYIQYNPIGFQNSWVSKQLGSPTGGPCAEFGTQMISYAPTVFEPIFLCMYLQTVKTPANQFQVTLIL